MAFLRYNPKDIGDLRKILADQPDSRMVEADPDTLVSAKTVHELREMKTWRSGLVVTTPREDRPEATVKISKSS